MLNLEAYGAIESDLIDRGLRLVGVDEVGKGALAGPVCVSAVILDYQALYALDTKRKRLIRDSKSLSKKQRVEAELVVREISVSSSVVFSDVTRINELGLSPATNQAMVEAVEPMNEQVDLILVDGKFKVPGFSKEQKTIIGGDHLCFCIAAASILAKNARDLWMNEQEHQFPGYGFSRHVGYGTKVHIDAIHAQGPCSLHRKDFKPISDYYARESLSFRE